MEEYGLVLDEEAICKISKDRWKELVRTAIQQKVLESLYADCISKSKTCNVPRYTSFSQQEYFQYLSPSKARMFFQLRAGVYDFKCNRPFLHRDDICRLCETGSESTDHVLNQCRMISRNEAVFENLSGGTEEEVSQVLYRVEQFQNLIKEREKERSSE